MHVIPFMWGVDGDKTVGISDTLRITDDGCESFFELEENFTVKPEQAAPTNVHSIEGASPSEPAHDAHVEDPDVSDGHVELDQS